MTDRWIKWLVLTTLACFPWNTSVVGARYLDHAGMLSGRLFLTGSSTMAPLVQEIGKRFHDLNPEVTVEVEAGGSTRGIDDARQGKADIGMASRALTDGEGDLSGFSIARDGVCIILHGENPLTALTDREIADIFTGKIGNWSMIGGKDHPIVVITPRKGYSSVELFVHYFKVDYDSLASKKVVGDNAERIKAVVAEEYGITFVSVGEAERKARAGIPIKLLPTGGVEATSKNVRSGNFPISRPLTLVTRGLPTGLAKAFIEFSLSSQVTDLVLEHDFVPYMD